MDGKAYAIGLGIGVLAGLAGYLIWWLACGRKCGRKYDERQIAAQGRAAKAAFFTNLIYTAACIAVFTAMEAPSAVVQTALFLGLLLSVGVYAVVCILRDAYFNLSDSPRKTLILLGVLAAIQFLNVWRNFPERGLFSNGEPVVMVWMPLMTGAVIVIVIATSLIKLAADKGRGSRDEES